MKIWLWDFCIKYEQIVCTKKPNYSQIIHLTICTNPVIMPLVSLKQSFWETPENRKKFPKNETKNY